jgi:hypothetical protein
LSLAGEFHSFPHSIFSSNPTNPKMPRPKSLRETSRRTVKKKSKEDEREN